VAEDWPVRTSCADQAKQGTIARGEFQPQRFLRRHNFMYVHEEKMIVEMRIYHCAPGRLPALNDRFSNITLDFFKKYGIEPMGFWTTLSVPGKRF
jgi:NIPSNAP